MTSRKERSKTGCAGCLFRKIKCDERRPTCQQCVKAKTKCSWDPSSRSHVQRSRRRRKNTAYTTTVSKMNYPSAENGYNGNSPNTFLTKHFELQSSGKSRLEAPSCGVNGGVLLHSPGHDTENPTEIGHTSRVRQCCLNNDLKLEMPTLISSYIHPPPLPCANSVLLSHQDRLYLEYFPRSSLVKVLGKAYTWSNFRYICQSKASEEASVMYAVLAMSASEMNQGLELPHAQCKGKFYYSLALKYIADAVNTLTCESHNMEAILGALFLVIAYARRFGSSLSSLQTHNQCLSKFLNIFRRISEYGPGYSIDPLACPPFTPFCGQMLLWILYLDSSCIGANLCFGLMNHFHNYGEDSLLHRLFRISRRSYLFIHGERYPAEQHQDDLENYCPLELIHQDYIFRYQILLLIQRYSRGEDIDSELENLYNEMNIIQKAFNDMFELQKNPPKDYHRSRAFITLCEGLAGYHCNILLIHRLFRHRVSPIDRVLGFRV